MAFYHLRIARPVSCLARSCEMYSRGLKLEVLGSFTDHAGFDGCMLGQDGQSWHLEFTQCIDHPLTPNPTVEDLLVLYIPQHEAWQDACKNMDNAGFRRVAAFNPYWDIKGTTFEDEDGYRVVIQNNRWRDNP